MTELGLPAFLSNQVGTQLGARACDYAGVYMLGLILSYTLTSLVCHRCDITVAGGTMLVYNLTLYP